MNRATAIILCKHCAWRAKHTADTPGEVIEFLDKVLKAHLEEQHG